MAILNIISFGLNIMMVWSFIFIIYILWLIRRKVEKTSVFNKIFTWLLFGIISILAYGLLAAMISFLALELTDNIIVMTLYLPWVLFSFCIYKVGKTLWDMTKNLGIEIKEPEKKILESEIEKIKGTLRLLETEYKEGIISKKAYEELNFRNETKLAEMDAKLAELILTRGAKKPEETE